MYIIILPGPMPLRGITLTGWQQWKTSRQSNTEVHRSGTEYSNSRSSTWTASLINIPNNVCLLQNGIVTMVVVGRELFCLMICEKWIFPGWQESTWVSTKPFWQTRLKKWSQLFVFWEFLFQICTNAYNVWFRTLTEISNENRTRVQWKTEWMILSTEQEQSWKRKDFLHCRITNAYSLKSSYALILLILCQIFQIQRLSLKD